MARKGPQKALRSEIANVSIEASLEDPYSSSEDLVDSVSSRAHQNAINLPAHQTKHLAELVYRFPTIETSFHLKQRNDTNSTGSSLWLSSQVLSAYLLHTYAKAQDGRTATLPRKKMLELGSGTGLLSLLMARLGWQVFATDIPPVLDSVLKPNVEAGLAQMEATGQATADQIQVCELDWTDLAPDWNPCSTLRLPSTGVAPNSTQPTNKSHFDLILTADTIYEPSLIRPLFSTIANLIRHQGGQSLAVLLALERRDPAHITEALRIARAEYDLSFKQIPAKRVRKIFDTLGDGATWSRDDWDGVEIWKL